MRGPVYVVQTRSSENKDWQDTERCHDTLMSAIEYKEIGLRSFERMRDFIKSLGLPVEEIMKDDVELRIVKRTYADEIIEEPNEALKL